MTLFTGMSPLAAAALHIGLLIFVMFGLKSYVGAQRYKHQVAPGEAPTSDFARAMRVQMNAVEDVPVLMVGLLSLALLGMPAWYVHLTGGALVISRVLHAVGLGSSGGRTFGRSAGTIGTAAVYLAIGGALLVHAFYRG
jgi:uncharacterized protein